MRRTIILLLVFSSFFITACSYLSPSHYVYRAPKQQGNLITQAEVDQLKPDMNKEQVQFILGTPMIQDSFDTNRWDYIYTYDSGSGETDYQRISLFFENNALVQILGNIKPSS